MSSISKKVRPEPPVLSSGVLKSILASARAIASARKRPQVSLEELFVGCVIASKQPADVYEKVSLITAAYPSDRLEVDEKVERLIIAADLLENRQ